MKLDLRKHVFHDTVDVNSWLGMCSAIKKNEIPCLNFTRTQLRNNIQDKKHLFTEDCIVTSKGTDIIDFFDIDEILIENVPIRECTDKQLRKSHNIRKMYIANAFDPYFNDSE